MSDADYIAQLEAQTARQSQLLAIALDALAELGFTPEELAEAAGLELA